MELIFIFVVFSTPLLAVSIFVFWKRISASHSRFKSIVFLTNIFLISTGPLLISLILLKLSSLPTPIAAVTLAGFVPSVASFSFWYVLANESDGITTHMNVGGFTILNILLPILLTSLYDSDVFLALLGIFSYEFIALAIGVTAAFIFGPLIKILNTKRIALGLVFLGAVMVGPGLYYEYVWISRSVLNISSAFHVDDVLVLLSRYFSLFGFSLFIYKSLEKMARQ